MMSVKYNCIKAKSILSGHHWDDSWFHVTRSMNAFRGCEFGCVYCDGMSEQYHVEDFLTHVQIKENAAMIVRNELQKDGFSAESTRSSETLLPFIEGYDQKRLLGDEPIRYTVGVSGGVSDAYQQAEQHHRVTREVLEVLLDFGMPVFILTKSTLVLRDIDLLKQINEIAYATVAFTITLNDEETKKIFEPKSPETSERFEALKEIRRAGIHGGVMAMPIIPLVGDTQENLRNLAKRTKSAGGEFIQWGGLTLKPGRQKDYFFGVLKKRFPDEYPTIQRIYQNNDKYGSPLNGLLPVNVYYIGHRICNEDGIRDRMPRLVLPGSYESNTLVAEILQNIAYYRTYVLKDRWNLTRPLFAAASRILTERNDLRKLRNEGVFKQKLDMSDRVYSVIEEILETGSSKAYREVLLRIAELEE